MARAVMSCPARSAGVLLLCWLSGGGTAAAAGQTVTGVVVEAGSSEPLPGVLVSLLDTDDERAAAALTDDDGRFTVEPGRFGRFRLRAERIGLQTTTSASFDLFSTIPREERIPMGQRAIEIEGLVVDSRIEQCRLDRDRAVTIQRWWQEIRTALDVSAVVQNRGLARFQVERFEREWGSGLSRVIAEARHTEVGRASRTFVSVDAALLADGGFIQGDVGSSRDYYAPDAEVLLSDVFLSRHCFSLSGHDDDEIVGLSFEPTRDDVADISGTLWVDTTTAELQSLDFRYANQGDDVPDNEAGGFVSFEYLPTGAWVVREWYIRMPSLARDRRGRIRVVGYVDVGGRAEPLTIEPVAARAEAGVGAVRGVVWNRVGDGALPGAMVSILGTDLTAVTDEAGEFVFPSVPVGEHHLTFSHPEPAAWGVGAPLTTVDVRNRRTVDVRLAVPEFRRVASVICLGGGLRARAVLVGHVVDEDGVGLGGATIVLTWRRDDDDSRDDVAPDRQDVRTDGDGRFVACAIPAETKLQVDVRVDGMLIRAFEVMVAREGVEYRRVQLPIGRRDRGGRGP